MHILPSTFCPHTASVSAPHLRSITAQTNASLSSALHVTNSVRWPTHLHTQCTMHALGLSLSQGTSPHTCKYAAMWSACQHDQQKQTRLPHPPVCTGVCRTQPLVAGTGNRRTCQARCHAASPSMFCSALTHTAGPVGHSRHTCTPMCIPTQYTPMCTPVCVRS